ACIHEKKEKKHFYTNICSMKLPPVNNLRNETFNTSIKQSNKFLYPSFFRTIPSDKNQRMELILMAYTYRKKVKKQKQEEEKKKADGLLDAGDGYSKCSRKAMRLIANSETRLQATRLLLHLFQKLQKSQRTLLLLCSVSPP
uniref:Taste 1 receptor member 2 n=1 Tax=Oryzias latipes TaxID=8090 RepID=A0A3B3I614_ORYLA